jgi:hypothetical protein
MGNAMYIERAQFIDGDVWQDAPAVRSRDVVGGGVEHRGCPSQGPRRVDWVVQVVSTVLQ